MHRLRIDWFPILLGALFIVMVSVPYILAYQSAGEAYRFGGFLLNPIDGNSYLAKMYQGWQGSLRFKLPYTIEQGEGGYLFLFYLALGHLARISEASLPLIYHLFRIASALVLVIGLWFFFGRVFTRKRTRRLAFGLALFGSGMGWLVSFFGILSADFWVSEGYPFLSAYSNPHFPLGLAIMLGFLAPSAQGNSQTNTMLTMQQRIIYLISGFVLAVLMPFGVVITCVVLAAALAWEFLESLNNQLSLTQRLSSILFHSQTGQKLILLILGSATVLIYQVWVSRSDPILAAWNAQNITLSPSLWKLLIAYSPIVLAAIPGIYFALKATETRPRILLLWAGLGLLLLYIPWNLQRRFISGYMIPLAGLAAITMDRLYSRKKIVGMAALGLIIVLMIPTNLMIVLGGIQAVENKDASLFLTNDEFLGLKWIEENTDEQAVILASPEMGLVIPAYTGRRVWYGHPFETAGAARMETKVLNYFASASSEDSKEILKYSDYLFLGRRERELGEIEIATGFELEFESGEIFIYRIN